MRKLIILAIAILGFSFAEAQSFENASVMRENSYGFYGGTAADTLVASDTLQLLVRVHGNSVRDINLAMELTKVSGTVTNNFFIAGSMDGDDWDTDLDTIAYSNASSGVTYVRLENFNYAYLRVIGIAGATAQKAGYKLFYINRED